MPRQDVKAENQVLKLSDLTEKFHQKLIEKRLLFSQCDKRPFFQSPYVNDTNYLLQNAMMIEVNHHFSICVVRVLS